jgi:hypothetical protein
VQRPLISLVIQGTKTSCQINGGPQGNEIVQSDIYLTDVSDENIATKFSYKYPQHQTLRHPNLQTSSNSDISNQLRLDYNLETIRYL